MADRAYLERRTRELIDKGKLVEAGWVSLRLMAIPPDASAAQLSEMRHAFFAGAQHLFASVMTMMNPGEEPTAADMRRMENIADELEDFIREFTVRNLPTKGQA